MFILVLYKLELLNESHDNFSLSLSVNKAISRPAIIFFINISIIYTPFIFSLELEKF